VATKTAVELIVETVRARPGEVHLLATAPLTNVAAALRAEPRLPHLVDGITVMGGAAMAPGNITPAAEANIWHDPEAAHAVLAAPWPITLVPLDATMGEVMTEGQRLQMAESSSPVAKFAASVLDFYFEFYTGIYGKKSSACHDVLAAAIAVGDVVPKRSMRVPVSVETGFGPARGATVCDTRGQYKDQFEAEGANCTVVLETGGDFSTAVVERLCAFQPR
jgi:purine nucleosidase